jgi:hypothetical protein
MNRGVLRATAAVAVAMICVVVWSTTSASAQSGSRKIRRSRASGPPASQPAVPALRFEGTVFQVVVAKEQVVDLDSTALADRADTAQHLAEALHEFGPVEVLYRVDQAVPMDARTHRIDIATTVPYVSGTQTSSTGQISTSIKRTSVGGIFGVWIRMIEGVPDDHVQLNLDVELASMTGSTIDLGQGVSAPVFWEVTQTFGGTWELGRPIVLLSVDGAATTGRNEPLALVTLVNLRRVDE